MKRSISGRANCAAPGAEDRGPMLAEIAEVYGEGMAEVARRYIDAPDPHPHEQYQQEARGQSGSGVSDGSLPEGMGCVLSPASSPGARVIRNLPISRPRFLEERVS